MIIRSMNEKDIPRVCEIENATFSQPWKREDFISSINNPNNIYLVVEDEGKVIAYCGLWNIVGVGHINNVAVDKEYQHRGIAYRMLSKLIVKARFQSINSFTLEVRISNKRAINLYEKLGFKSVGIRPNFYEMPREDGMIMWM